MQSNTRDYCVVRVTSKLTEHTLVAKTIILGHDAEVRHARNAQGSGEGSTHGAGYTTLFVTYTS